MLSRKFYAYLLVLISAFFTGISLADTATNLPYSSLTDEQVNEKVQNITKNKRILEAQLELQELLEKASGPTAAPQGNTVIEPPREVSNGIFKRKNTEPAVISIEGPKDDLVALLKVGTGSVLRVRTGDTANGWKVKDINDDGVIATKDGETKLLPFTVMNSNQLNNPNQQY
ncbi:MAG: type IV pilus biogenesis protein PilP [Hydrogenovibrio sp.]